MLRMRGGTMLLYAVFMENPSTWLLSTVVLIDTAQQVHVDQPTRYDRELVDYGEFCCLGFLAPPYVLVKWRKVPSLRVSRGDIYPDRAPRTHHPRPVIARFFLLPSQVLHWRGWRVSFIFLLVRDAWAV